ncbi:hypothetical protein E2C01_070771 [Portunus trituberculatus]|uniref:Uncharacterized protein n=1 Tax=Portunus trituberculatus TaxID=210409 RepID=A0A5B7HTL8_PORTR|nr:hypothetical protein [Portunus trituberculatus]
MALWCCGAYLVCPGTNFLHRGFRYTS